MHRSLLGEEAAFEGGGAAGPLQSSVSLSSRRPCFLGRSLLSLWKGVVLELAVLQSGHGLSSAASKATGV